MLQVNTDLIVNKRRRQRRNIGTAGPNVKLEITSVSDQLRLGYNSTSYTDLRSDSAGGLLIKSW